MTTEADPPRLFASMRSKYPVHQVRLADGHEATLALGDDAARNALMEARFSKDMVASLTENPEVDDGLPGPPFAHHMLAVDPPTAHGTPAGRGLDAGSGTQASSQTLPDQQPKETLP